jgi:hypothetical protein
VKEETQSITIEEYIEYKSLQAQNKLLLEAVEAIANSQEVSPHGFIDKKLHEALKQVKDLRGE